MSDYKEKSEEGKHLRYRTVRSAHREGELIQRDVCDHRGLG